MIVEVINDGRPVAIGEWDELVATGLHSFGMPHLYDTDLAILVTKGTETYRLRAAVFYYRGDTGSHD
jgi:hypothetical protein